MRKTRRKRSQFGEDALSLEALEERLARGDADLEALLDEVTSRTGSCFNLKRNAALLECGKCHELLLQDKDPHKLSCCHRFCWNCVQNYLERARSQECPLCGVPYWRRDIQKDHSYLRLVEAVSQALKRSGCTLAPSQQEVPSHLVMDIPQVRASDKVCVSASKMIAEVQEDQAPDREKDSTSKMIVDFQSESCGINTEELQSVDGGAMLHADLSKASKSDFEKDVAHTDIKDLPSLTYVKQLQKELEYSSAESCSVAGDSLPKKDALTPNGASGSLVDALTIGVQHCDSSVPKGSCLVPKSDFERFVPPKSLPTLEEIEERLDQRNVLIQRGLEPLLDDTYLATLCDDLDAVKSMLWMIAQCPDRLGQQTKMVSNFEVSKSSRPWPQPAGLKRKRSETPPNVVNEGQSMCLLVGETSKGSDFGDAAQREKAEKQSKFEESGGFQERKRMMDSFEFQLIKRMCSRAPSNASTSSMPSASCVMQPVTAQTSPCSMTSVFSAAQEVRADVVVPQSKLLETAEKSAIVSAQAMSDEIPAISASRDIVTSQTISFDMAAIVPVGQEPTSNCNSFQVVAADAEEAVQHLNLQPLTDVQRQPSTGRLGDAKDTLGVASLLCCSDSYDAHGNAHGSVSEFALETQEMRNCPAQPIQSQETLVFRTSSQCPEKTCNMTQRAEGETQIVREFVKRHLGPEESIQHDPIEDFSQSQIKEDFGVCRPQVEVKPLCGESQSMQLAPRKLEDELNCVETVIDEFSQNDVPVNNHDGAIVESSVGQDLGFHGIQCSLHLSQLLPSQYSVAPNSQNEPIPLQCSDIARHHEIHTLNTVDAEAEKLALADAKCLDAAAEVVPFAEQLAVCKGDLASIGALVQTGSSYVLGGELPQGDQPILQPGPAAIELETVHEVDRVVDGRRIEERHLVSTLYHSSDEEEIDAVEANFEEPTIQLESMCKQDSLNFDALVEVDVEDQMQVVMHEMSSSSWAKPAHREPAVQTHSKNDNSVINVEELLQFPQARVFRHEEDTSRLQGLLVDEVLIHDGQEGVSKPSESRQLEGLTPRVNIQTSFENAAIEVFSQVPSIPTPGTYPKLVPATVDVLSQISAAQASGVQLEDLMAADTIEVLSQIPGHINSRSSGSSLGAQELRNPGGRKPERPSTDIRNWFAVRESSSLESQRHTTREVEGSPAAHPSDSCPEMAGSAGRFQSDLYNLPALMVEDPADIRSWLVVRKPSSVESQQPRTLEVEEPPAAHTSDRCPEMAGATDSLQSELYNPPALMVEDSDEESTTIRTASWPSGVDCDAVVLADENEPWDKLELDCSTPQPDNIIENLMLLDEGDHPGERVRTLKDDHKWDKPNDPSTLQLDVAEPDEETCNVVVIADEEQSMGSIVRQPVRPGPTKARGPSMVSEEVVQTMDEPCISRFGAATLAHDDTQINRPQENALVAIGAVEKDNLAIAHALASNRQGETSNQHSTLALVALEKEVETPSVNLFSILDVDPTPLRQLGKCVNIPNLLERPMANVAASSSMNEMVPLPAPSLQNPKGLNENVERLVTESRRCMPKTALCSALSLTQKEVHVVFSGFTGDEVTSLRQKVLEIGGQTWNCICKPEVTRLVITEPTKGRAINRTQKYLEALLQGCWIVSPDWVLRSYASKTWLPEEDFQIDKDPVRVGASKAGRRRWQNGKSRIFTGLRMSPQFSIGCTSGPKADLTRLMELGGAELKTWESGIRVDLSIDEPVFLGGAARQDVTRAEWWRRPLLLCAMDFPVHDPETIASARRDGWEVLDVRWFFNSISDGELVAPQFFVVKSKS